MKLIFKFVFVVGLLSLIGISQIEKFEEVFKSTALERNFQNPTNLINNTNIENIQIIPCRTRLVQNNRNELICRIGIDCMQVPLNQQTCINNPSNAACFIDNNCRSGKCLMGYCL